MGGLRWRKAINCELAEDDDSVVEVRLEKVEKTGYRY